MIRNGKECKRKLKFEVPSRDFSSNIDISSAKTSFHHTFVKAE